jgi:hypothetical protein
MKTGIRNISLRAILFVIAIGTWTLVIQNSGIVPISHRVTVENTVQTNAEVSGSVSVENTVDVNIHEINGYNTVTTASGTHSVFPYGYTLPVDNW